MELEVNKNHKKIDLSKIKKPLKRVSAGVLVSLCLFSGITTGKAYADNFIDEQPSITFEQQEELIVNVPKSCRLNISLLVGKKENEEITASDLEKIKYLNISVDDAFDPSFLSYCTNLKDLTLVSLTDNMIDIISEMPKIESLESLTLYNMFLNIDLTKDNTAFLDNNPNIKYLEIDGITMHPGVEETFKNIKTLRLGPQENIDIDFSKLTNLELLDVTELEPYTLAMHFNSDEYEKLKQNGVEIRFADGQEEKYLKANQKLDEIVKSLNVTQESTDREKLDAILLYTLQNLTYDEDIAYMSDEEIARRDIASEFYKDGLLHAVIEKDTAICGNYAALVEALSDRLGNPQDSFYMTSNSHAWNLMNIDGELYYVDSTWLDEQVVFVTENINGFETLYAKTSEEKIAAGEGEEVPWYMENPSSYNIATQDPSGMHIPNINVPTYMEEKTKNYYFDYNVKNNQIFASNQKVTIKVNNEEQETSLGEVIGAMVGFGLAVSLASQKNKKQKDEEEKNQRKR